MWEEWLWKEKAASGWGRGLGRVLGWQLSCPQDGEWYRLSRWNSRRGNSIGKGLEVGRAGSVRGNPG